MDLVRYFCRCVIIHRSSPFIIFLMKLSYMSLFYVLYVHCRGRAVTNVGKTCGPTPCLTRAINMFKLTVVVLFAMVPAKIIFSVQQKRNVINFSMEGKHMVPSKYEPPRGKTNNVVSEQV